MARGSRYRLSEHERAQVLAWGLACVPLAEQARRLGRPPTNLIATIRAYQRAGQLPRRGRAVRGPIWTAFDRDRLKELIDQGHGYTAIARRLGRTETAVRIQAKRMRYRLLHTRAALTCRAAAQLLGLGCQKSVTRWIAGYGLNARNAGTKARPIWRIQWEDLCAWLEDPDHWMAYDPARCTEPPLREHLCEIRAGQPGWVSIGDVARRYCVLSNTVGQWIVKGFLPATRYGNWWIRASDLEGWLPPCERSKAGIPKANGRIVTGPDRIVTGPPVERKQAA